MSRLSDKSGFTIVELLVSISVMGILMTVIFNTLFGFYYSTTDSLSITTQDTSTRSALRQIDKEIAAGTTFSNTLTPPVPLGPSLLTPTWTYDSTADKQVLIASVYATVQSTGMVVYTNNSLFTSCTAPDPNTDTLAKVQFIYFTAPNSTTGTDTLYRRTIVDPNACTNSPLSRTTSCAVTVSRTLFPICQSSDAVLLDNVSLFQLKFFAAPTDTAPVTGTGVNTASTVEISARTQPPSGNKPASTAKIRISLSSINS